MRRAFVDRGGPFSYIAPEARVPVNHPLRKIRELVRDVLGEPTTLPRLGSGVAGTDPWVVDQVHDEIQVYNAEINEVGQWSYEQHLNYVGIVQTRPGTNIDPGSSERGRPARRDIELAELRTDP